MPVLNNPGQAPIRHKANISQASIIGTKDLQNPLN